MLHLPEHPASKHLDSSGKFFNLRENHLFKRMDWFLDGVLFAVHQKNVQGHAGKLLEDRVSNFSEPPPFN